MELPSVARSLAKVWARNAHTFAVQNHAKDLMRGLHVQTTYAVENVDSASSKPSLRLARDSEKRKTSDIGGATLVLAKGTDRL